MSWCGLPSQSDTHSPLVKDKEHAQHKAGESCGVVPLQLLAEVGH
jgi:hypothetical protein